MRGRHLRFLLPRSVRAAPEKVDCRPHARCRRVRRRGSRRRNHRRDSGPRLAAADRDRWLQVAFRDYSRVRQRRAGRPRRAKSLPGDRGRQPLPRRVRQLPEDLRIGPMEIFDNHQRWSSATSMRGERCCQRALSAMACGVIHGVVERTPFICLLQIEKVKSENKPLARYHPVRHQALGHAAPRFGFCRGRQAKQAQE
jgi:hypothetical protein